jgi:hypothetical protein
MAITPDTYDHRSSSMDHDLIIPMIPHHHHPPANTKNDPTPRKRADSLPGATHTSTCINRSPLQYVDSYGVNFETRTPGAVHPSGAGKPVHLDMHVPMDSMDNTPVPRFAVELTEEQLQEQAPRVRGQLISRFEDMYRIVSAEIERGDLEQRLDPRFVELAMRILDREMRLYRLTDAPKVAVEEPEEEAVVSLRNRQQIEQQLRELEAKLPPSTG